MFRRLSGVLGLLFLGALVSLSPAADDPPKGPQAPNPDRAFRFGDVNKDGKLSKEEFLKLVGNAPRLKDNPGLAELLFRRLDTNSDGFLSLEEYRKIAQFRQPMKPAEPKPQPKPEPVAINRLDPPEEIAFFEKKIRPVLVQHCYKCHSAQSEKIKGGLVLDTREGIRKGGELGPAVIPGDSSSLLLKAIRHQGDLKMPARKLPDEVIADFERWVRNGAADPRDGATHVVKQEIDIEKGRQFWAFQRPTKSAAAGRQGRFLASRGHRPLCAGRAGSEGIEASRRRRSVHPDPPGVLRPDRPAADAGGDRGALSRSRRPGRKRLMKRWSIACWRRRASASAGAGIGSTWPASPSPPASKRTWAIRTPGAIAITSSPPSTPTSPTIASSASSWPAICSRPPTPNKRRNSSSPPVFWPSAPRTTTNAIASSSSWTWSMNRSRPLPPPSWP